jgi:hypothetical protein
MLGGAALMGSWEAAGLCPEISRCGDIYGWKFMRCGCIFVVCMYPRAEATSRSGRTFTARERRRAERQVLKAILDRSVIRHTDPDVDPSLPQEHPEGGQSSTLSPADRARRENHPSTGIHPRFKSMGEGQ